MAAVRSTAASLRQKIRRGECEGSSNASRIPANDGRDVLRGGGSGSFTWRGRAVCRELCGLNAVASPESVRLPTTLQFRPARVQ